MKISILIGVTISVLCGCVAVNSSADDAPIELSPSRFAEHNLSYVSNGNFEQYTFSGEGEPALCSRGGKEEALGLVYDWEIIDAKTLQLTAKKVVNARVIKTRLIEGYPCMSQAGEIKFSEIDDAIKVIRLQFNEIKNNRAVTTDGRVFKMVKYEL